MADIDALVEATVAQLKGIIKNPKPDAKLLKRPPYRFLRDVVVEVAKQTQFLEGLFTPEEAANDKASKDEKINFLQKAIDATSFATGETLAVKPGKVVAGRDAELTNLWLQAVAGAASSGVDSSEAVQKVLSGERPGKSKSKDKENKEKPEKEKSAKAKPASGKEKVKPASGKEKAKPAAGKEKGKKGKGKEDEKRARDARPSEASRDRKSKRGGTDSAKKKSGSAKAKSGSAKKKAAPETAEGGDDDAPEPAQEPDQAAEDAGEPEPNEPGAELGNLAPEDPEPRKERPPSARLSGRKRQTAAPADDAQEDDDGGEGGDGGAQVSAYPDAEEPAAPPPRQPTPEPPQPPPQQQEEERAQDPTADIELPEQPLPGNVRRRERIARPTTARAAPPKRKVNQEDEEAFASAGQEDTDVNVMVDDDKDDEDEDDMYVVVDNENNISPMPAAPAAAEDDGEAEGALMRKIREKKAGATQEVTQEAVTQAGEAQRARDRDAASKEIERLREDIQSLCRSANPLGKIVDYIQEDVDAMQKEMGVWKKEHAEHSNSLSEEALITENEVQPIKVRLGDLDQQIKDQEDLIAATKAIVAENDSKIQRMLDGVAFAARS